MRRAPISRRCSRGAPSFVRAKEITATHTKLLRALSGRISRRLQAEFTDLPGEDGPGIGIELREGGKRVVIAVPAAILLAASNDATAREEMRVRIKARRDRLVFRPAPAPLPKNIVATPLSSNYGRGPGFGRRF